MTTGHSLIGLRVTVRANDFVDAVTHGRIRLVDPSTNSILLEFDAPIDAGGVRYSKAVASPRLAHDKLVTLVKEGELGCGITWIPDTRFDSKAPFDLTWWRGGAAAIADIVLHGDRLG